uniref:Protein C' n=2 Tax=Vesicular stomatitis New Jersey virus (strain Missouri subtype Hazelhurst) TaxID=11282 RepID=C_VSNJM|nr:RecName: Full=Protein C' [Vesicular stomatitis virus (serotype New Jersey / strain Missouri)]
MIIWILPCRMQMSLKKEERINISKTSSSKIKEINQLRHIIRKKNRQIQILTIMLNILRCCRRMKE